MAALVVNRDYHIHAVAQAGLIVVGTKAGGSVNTAGTGIHGYVIGQYQTGGLIQEGVRSQHVLIEAAGMRFQYLISIKAADLHDLIGESFGHDIHFTVGSLNNGVLLHRVHGNSKVTGQGPDSGGPDNKAQLILFKMGEFAAVVVHGELDIHGGAGVITIFNLSLGQSCLVLAAPVNGLKTFVDMTVEIHFTENANLICFKALAHGGVGILPIADNTKALETLALNVNILVGVCFAGAAEIRNAHLLVVELLLFDNSAFNGHAMVIPAGDIGGVVAAHGVGTHDKVLDRLIQCVTHVDITVGEGRAVVEREAGLTLVLLEHFVIYIQLFPVLEHVRLALGKPGTHGKIGFRQINGCVEIL